MPPLYDSSRSNLEMANIKYNTIAERSRKIKIDEQESRLPEDDNCYEPALANLEQYFPLKKWRQQDKFQENEAVLDYELDQISINSSSNHESFIKLDDEEDGNDSDDASFIDPVNNDDVNNDDDGNDDRFSSEDEQFNTFNTDSWIIL